MALTQSTVNAARVPSNTRLESIPLMHIVAALEAAGYIVEPNELRTVEFAHILDTTTNSARYDVCFVNDDGRLEIGGIIVTMFTNARGDKLLAADYEQQ